ncbi:UxaA family hydrolase [Mesotoga infera]|uniref:UxaA family hydrolase n=1 Tax=Mesotoga infera TaxID=1236046 RepID=UPI00146CDB06|nr:UxaA family hydrolase [Mesotoga infera]
MHKTIKGYIRKDGNVGFRNYVLVLPSVICSSKVAERIASSVPGCAVARHNQGCAQLGEDFHQTRRTLINTALNPNVAAVIVIGLGCERVSPHELRDLIAQAGKPVELIMVQEVGNGEAIRLGREKAREFVIEASKIERQSVPLSALTIGVECGGSDFSSGLSANPVVGHVADLVWGNGGRVILSETTELVGAEHLLFERMSDDSQKERFTRMLERMINESRNNSRDMVDRENIPNNISPGNVRGGLTTLEEKSLGAMIKGGKVPIVGVKEYGECIERAPGLYLMDSPGYDVESVTGMVAGGASIILFTTGQGTPTGNPIAPVIKITGNRDTAVKMRDSIDFDCSAVISGGETLEKSGERLFDLLIDVSNGAETKSELLGQDDYSIWNVGIKL